MIIKDAQYKKHELIDVTYITAKIDGKVSSVPLDPDNIHYAEILKQVADGTLTIKDAE
tara:strand:- start:23 stop:196 length:174 start_codon:yes stop_codon:yes gene_type:complete